MESEGDRPHSMITYGGDGDDDKQLLALTAADEYGGAICLRCGPGDYRNPNVAKTGRPAGSLPAGFSDCLKFPKGAPYPLARTVVRR